MKRFVLYQIPDVDLFPAGRMLMVDGVMATMVTKPLPYVFTATDPVDAESHEHLLEHVRQRLAAAGNLRLTPTTPKLATVSPGHGSTLAFRTRKESGGGWHPRVPTSGLVALGVALFAAGTVPFEIAGSFTGSYAAVSTPAGVREIEVVLRGGRRAIRVAASPIEMQSFRDWCAP